MCVNEKQVAHRNFVEDDALTCQEYVNSGRAKLRLPLDLSRQVTKGKHMSRMIITVRLCPGLGIRHHNKHNAAIIHRFRKRNLSYSSIKKINPLTKIIYIPTFKFLVNKKILIHEKNLFCDSSRTVPERLIWEKVETPTLH